MFNFYPYRRERTRSLTSTSKLPKPLYWPSWSYSNANKKYFLGCSNDGASCDSAFLAQVILDFLRGNIIYSVHTETNHNAKSSDYQLAIGGNNIKIVVIYLIDIGLLKNPAYPKTYFVQNILQDIYLCCGLYHQK